MAQGQISLCMIAKNEEKNLARCLSSVQGEVDEVIIIDTGSSDRTCDIARTFGASVYTFPWNDNFSDARNASIEKAQGEWILFLDADEEIQASSLHFLKELTKDDTIEGYFVKITNYIGNPNWTETCNDLVFRLFRNKKEYRFRGAIHEQIADVILEKNPHAKYQIAEGLEILHYGYLDDLVLEKDKKTRNLFLIETERVKNPDNPLLRYHYGVELYRAERYSEAASELIAVANALDPNTIYMPKLLRYIVLAQYSSDQLPEALQTISVALGLFPDYADLYYQAGLIYWTQNKFKSSADAFKKAISMPPQPPQYASFAGVRGFRAYYYLGKIAEEFLNFEKALEYYLFSLRDNPSFTPSLEQMIHILNPTLEPEYCQKCIESVCEFCTDQANLLIANLYFRYGAYSLALHYYSEIPTLSIEDRLLKAICLCQERRDFEALRLLDDLSNNPNIKPLVLVNKLLCYWVQDKLPKVHTLYKDLINMGLSSETIDILNTLVGYSEKRPLPKIKLQPENEALFLDIVQRLIALNELHRVEFLIHHVREESLVPHYSLLANLFLAYGFNEEAMTYLRKDLEYHENEHPDTHYKMALRFKEKGQYIQAEYHYKKALEYDSTKPRYSVSLIECYRAWRERIINKGLEIYPQSPLKTLSEGEILHE